MRVFLRNGLWFIDQFEQERGNQAYLMPAMSEIEGAINPSALQHAFASSGKPRRVAPADDPFTARFDANEPDVGIGDEAVEDPHGVAAPAYTGNDNIGLLAHVISLTCTSPSTPGMISRNAP